MKLDGVSTLSSIHHKPTAPPRALSKQPENESEVTATEDGGKTANGVISKLNEGGHFKGVAAVRLLISHFDNADLEKIDPAQLPDSEDIPGKAYEKFLAQYRSLYNASHVPTEPEEPVVEIPEPDTEPIVIEDPMAEILPVPEEQPVVEVPMVSEEPPIAQEPVNEIPVTDAIFVPPLEIEPVATLEQASPVDESEGILAVQ